MDIKFQKKKSITDVSPQHIDDYDDYPRDIYYDDIDSYSEWIDVDNKSIPCDNCDIESHAYDIYTDQYYCYQCDKYIDNVKKLPYETTD